MTSFILRPALHHTLGAALSDTKVGVQWTSRLLYNLLLFPVDLSCTDTVNKNRLIETAFRHSEQCLTCAHTHKGTPQLGVVWAKTQLEIRVGNQQQMWCKVLQMEAGNPNY